MNIRFISILLLLGFSWNGLLGVSGGVFLHLHDAEHGHASCHSDVHDCAIESQDDCCYESHHMLIEAEEIVSARLSETTALKAPLFERVLIAYLFDPIIVLSAPQAALEEGGFKRGLPAPDNGSVALLETVVLRV